MIELNVKTELNNGDVVQCYRNLRKKNFSIRNKETKRVVAHGNGIVLEDVFAKVSEKSRQRVVRERMKNVHAVLEGKFIDVQDLDTDTMEEIYYNPYKVDGFVVGNIPFTYAKRIYLKDDKAWIIER